MPRRGRGETRTDHHAEVDRHVPQRQEAWSEFRRTGYPKVIPIVNNLSGGKVDTNVQVRRMTFPRSEYSNNAVGVAAATALLGGADTGGTKLWWDKK